MEEKKLTKRDLYGMVKDIVADSDSDDRDELIEFIDKQIEIIDNKAAKAKERAAEKRAAGDELRATVKDLLTSEFQTAEDILAQLDDEEVTKAKIIARLGQLVKAGEAEKTDVKTESGRTVKAYRLV